MTDAYNKAVRSKNTRVIATHDIAIEKHLVNVLTEQEVTFRVQGGALPGRPNFMVDDYHCVIFTYDCLWHYHDCYLSRVPATRTEFQLGRIGKNVQCDARDCEKPRILDWYVLIVWECTLRGREKLDDEVLSERAIEWIRGGSDTV